jgi:ribosomal protein L29
MLNTKELRKKSEKELNELLSKTRKDLENTVSSTLQNKEKNVKKSKYLKRDVARIITILKENK